MQAVGQLDHDDADILCHSNEHLPQIFHLLLFLGGVAGVLHLGQLGDAIHQNGHHFAELLGHFGVAGFGVLDGIMEQTGHDGLGIQTHLLDVHRHCHGMHNIRLTAFAQLAVMMLIGILIGLENARFILRRESGGDGVDLLIQILQIGLHFQFRHTINPSK